MSKDNEKKQILNFNNWYTWLKQLQTECMGYEGMYECVMNLKKKTFTLDEEPDFREKAIMEGENKTSEETDDDGHYLHMKEVDGVFYRLDIYGDIVYKEKSYQDLYLKRYFKKCDAVEKEQLRYQNYIRLIIKFIHLTISNQIQEKLKATGENYVRLITTEDLPGLIKLLKQVATGKGANSIVLESQRLIRMKLVGGTNNDVIKTINDFKEAVDQLRYERTDKEVLDGLIDGLFVSMFVEHKPLDNQIERIMESETYPNYKDMSESFTRVLEAKENTKDVMLKKDTEDGLVSANMAVGGDSKKRLSKVMCLKCGEIGHAMRRCFNKTEWPVCSICKKSHHTKAHAAAQDLGKDRLSRAYNVVKDKGEKGVLTFMTQEEEDLEHEDQLAMSRSLDELITANRVAVERDLEDDEDVEEDMKKKILEG